jgi:hypothetical protein
MEADLGVLDAHLGVLYAHFEHWSLTMEFCRLASVSLGVEDSVLIARLRVLEAHLNLEIYLGAV